MLYHKYPSTRPVIDNVDTDGEILPRGRDPRKADFEIKTKGVKKVEQTVFERMGGTYHREGDYLLPDLEAPEAPRIGKYGLLRHQYLRAHKRAILTGLQMSGKLNAHLEQIDREATETEQRLIVRIAASEGVTESLKRRDQMAWVGAMNNIQNRAEELILSDLVCV